MSNGKQTRAPETGTVNFDFREKLNSVAEGFRHNFCYQCGACVADCPASIYSDHFNPRLIILKALLGFEDELIRPDSEIWDCTNCYTCSERCPQEVRPVDVIIAMKNICVAEGKAPEMVKNISDTVLSDGITTRVTSVTERRRNELGLTPMKKVPVDEINRIIED
jgi:heterodisulfide reductase subunit C